MAKVPAPLDIAEQLGRISITLLALGLTSEAITIQNIANDLAMALAQMAAEAATGEE